MIVKYSAAVFDNHEYRFVSVSIDMTEVISMGIKFRNNII